MTKTKLTLALEPPVVKKIETIASRSGLTVVQLLQSVALKLADGQLDFALSVTSHFNLQDLEFKINLESLIERHEGTPEELREELRKIRRQCYMNA